MNRDVLVINTDNQLFIKSIFRILTVFNRFTRHQTRHHYPTPKIGGLVNYKHKYNLMR
jgi:hypothetical protein